MLTKIALSVIGSLIFISLAVSMNKAEAKSDIYVLAMGANTNGLRQANADAKRFADTMRKKYHLPENNVIRLPNVTKDKFHSAIKKLNKIKTKKQVYVYFSGHGMRITARNKRAEGDCYDEALIFSGNKKYRDDDFAKKLNTLTGNTKLTTILDTCFAGGMTKASCSGSKAKVVPSTLACKTKPAKRVLKGLVMVAAHENQRAWEISDQGGRFTKELLYYLNRRDTSKKGAFTSAFRSARAKIIRDTKGTACYQRPQLFR